MTNRLVPQRHPCLPVAQSTKGTHENSKQDASRVKQQVGS
jgi:hypothetical protein